MNYDKDIIKLKSINSTNDYALQLLNKNCANEFTIVCTDEQTAGRGQIGNSWESEPLQNLLCSIILRPSFLPIDKNFYLSQMFSLAVIDTLKKFVPNVCIKWPNDIYIDNKKLAGILIENSIMGSNIQTSVIGIGLNVNQKIFLSNAPNPISLSNILNRDLSVDNILETLIGNTKKWYNILRQNDYFQIASKYKNNLLGYNQTRYFRDANGNFEGKIINVKPIGKLVIERTDKSISEYNFKEVEHIF